MSRPNFIDKQHQRNTSTIFFKRLRLGTNLTQEQFAREIKVAVSTIRRWEKGLAEPTLNIWQVKQLCRTVNCTLDQLPDSLLLSSIN